MAIENLSAVTPDLVLEIGTLMTILKAAGILLIFYIIYVIFNAIINWKNNRRIKEMHNKIEKIEGKINNIEKAIVKRK